MSLYKRLEGLNQDDTTSVSTAYSGLLDSYQELKNRIHRRIIDESSKNSLFRRHDGDKNKLNARIAELCQQIIQAEPTVIPRIAADKIIAEMLDDVLGYGPIEGLLNDDTVTEIMVNGADQVYLERAGKLILTEVQFKDNAHVMRVIERIVAPLGRRIDESSPMVDARLPDGSRVNAIIPPLALDGPCLTIRKFAKQPFTFAKLVESGAMNQMMAEFLQACVAGNLNIVVAGGTGSGKTSTLNALSHFIPQTQRIVTIEDAAELQLQQSHVVSLESRPPNIEGKGAITIRDLVRNALRMRPDRIIVGEVRSSETLDMLQAMNTGHDGCMTTVHANTPRDVLRRVETMVLMAGMELPMKAIREQISSAFDLIIHQSRFRDGSRKITHITEVQGMEGDIIVLQDLFLFQQTSRTESDAITGTFRSCGLRPGFLEKLADNGIQLPNEFFQPY
ncbi:MAG TPA: CpaF family protein [Negativicutes bacterium]|jgi:pilus assembly protein CpaF